MLKFVCFALLISCAAAGVISSGSCGGNGDFGEATIEGCSGSGVCTVNKGNPTPITIKFTPKSQVTGGEYTITASYLGLNIEITKKALSAGVSLPIAAGSSATHTHSLNLASNVISVQATATLKITDQSGAVIVCRTLTIKIA